MNAVRAARIDLVLQRPVLLGGGVISLVVLLLASGGITTLAVVPILLAVGVPVALAARDPLAEATLRGGLGVSRAAHVRARTALVLVLQLLLLLVAAAVIPLGAWADGADLRPDTYWTDVALWTSAVLWSHLWVGRDAMSRRSTTTLWAQSLGAYALAYVGGFLVLALAGWGARLTVSGAGGIEAYALAQTVGVSLGAAVLLLGALATLRLRSRVWARTA